MSTSLVSGRLLGGRGISDATLRLMAGGVAVWALVMFARTAKRKRDAAARTEVVQDVFFGDDPHTFDLDESFTYDPNAEGPYRG